MNKNIKIEFVIGIIIFISGILGGLIYFQDKRDVQSDIATNVQARQKTLPSKMQDQVEVQQKKTSPSLNVITIEANDAVCKSYSDMLSKYGKISHGTSVSDYIANSNGVLCSVTAEKIANAPDFNKEETEITSILKNDGWQDTGNGGDKPGIGDFGSTTIYKKNNTYLVFERGVKRDNAKINVCMDSYYQDATADRTTACINKIEATVFFTVMAGDQA